MYAVEWVDMFFFFPGVFGNINNSTVFREDESSLFDVLESRGREGMSKEINYAVKIVSRFTFTGSGLCWHNSIFISLPCPAGGAAPLLADGLAMPPVDGLAMPPVDGLSPLPPIGKIIIIKLDMPFPLPEAEEGKGRSR